MRIKSTRHYLSKREKKTFAHCLTRVYKRDKKHLCEGKLSKYNDLKMKKETMRYMKTKADPVVVVTQEMNSRTDQQNSWGIISSDSDKNNSNQQLVS